MLWGNNDFGLAQPPLEDNGIKVFGGDGYKLNDEEEGKIESLVAADDYPRPIGGGAVAGSSTSKMQSPFIWRI